jgi:hypothetical protein
MPALSPSAALAAWRDLKLPRQYYPRRADALLAAPQ